MSIAVIPIVILLLKNESNLLFHNAVSAAVIPFAILTLNCGSNSKIGPVNFSADLEKIANGTLNN